MKKFAKRLSCCNSKTVKDVIKNASKDELRHLVAHTMDIMKKKISARPQLIKLIKQNRGVLRHVVHPQYSLKSKRKYLIQKGSGLSSIFRQLGRSIRGRGRTESAAALMSPARGMELRSRTRLQTPGQAQRTISRERAIDARRGDIDLADPTENVLFDRSFRGFENPRYVPQQLSQSSRASIAPEQL